eukprot:1553919-Amphidinium_carterae.1
MQWKCQQRIKEDGVIASRCDDATQPWCFMPCAPETAGITAVQSASIKKPPAPARTPKIPQKLK